MKLLPEDPLDLGTSYASCHNQKLAFDESWKWFMDTSKVGQNQPLINDFTSFATASKKQESKLCFLISLRQIQPKSIDKNGMIDGVRVIFKASNGKRHELRQLTFSCVSCG